MSNIFLLAVSVAPAMLIGLFLYLMGKGNKVDWKIASLLFILGVLSTYPLRVIEKIVLKLITLLSSSEVVQQLNNPSPYGYTLKYFVFIFILIFIDAALIEEGGKFICFWLVEKKFKPINRMYDGVVCAVLAGIGFAARENWLFAVAKGNNIGMLRNIFSVSGHVVLGIVMGYCYSLYLAKRRAAEKEMKLIEEGIIPREVNRINAQKELIASLALPILIHTSANVLTRLGSSAIVVLLFLAFVLFEYICGIRILIKALRNNLSIDEYADRILRKKYPNQINVFRNIK